MTIDPTGKAQIQGSAQFPDTGDFDAAALLLALSAQQVNSLHDTMLARFDRAFTLQDRLNALGNASSKVTSVRDSVVAQESQAVDGTLSELQSLKPQESSSVTVTEADNERFAALKKWAEDRDLEFADFTKPKPLEEGEEASDPPEMILDTEALQQNIATVEGYQARVQAGTADNAVIRNLIEASPGFDALQKDVQHLLSSDKSIGTLNGLSAASDGLNQAVLQVQDEISIHWLQTDLIIDELRDKLQDFAAAKHERIVEPGNRREQIQQTNQRESQIEEMLNRLREIQDDARAKHAITQLQGVLDRAGGFAVVAELANQLAQAPAEQRGSVDRDLAAWQNDFDSRLEQVIHQRQQAKISISPARNPV